MINTKFWVDGYISNLDPIEKLLYLYLLTNPSTNIAGIYEVPIKSIAVDTGIDKEMVLKIFKRFEKDQKIKYKDGWVVIKNFIKHQKDNPKVKKGIELIKEVSPAWAIDYLYSIHSLSHSNSNSNSNININTNVKSEKVEQVDETSSSDISLVIKSFESINPASKKFYGNTTQRKSCQMLIDSYGLDRVVNVVENILPKSNTMKFFPVITTPTQLADKWATLESAIHRYQAEKKDIKNKVAF